MDARSLTVSCVGWRSRASGCVMRPSSPFRRLAEKKRRATCALQGESRRRLENALSLSRAIKPISDAGDTWDRDPFPLAVPNGVIDLRTGTLRPGTADDRITMSAVVPFDPAAPCPLWDRTIADVFGHDHELIMYIQRAIGYSLTGDCREECLFVLGLWPQRQRHAHERDRLAARRLRRRSAVQRARVARRREGIPNDIAKLVGKRFATASESGDTVRLNEARIKALTGRDPITARFLASRGTSPSSRKQNSGWRPTRSRSSAMTARVLVARALHPVVDGDRRRHITAHERHHGAVQHRRTVATGTGRPKG